jgi:ankyrin repeat protein
MKSFIRYASQAAVIATLVLATVAGYGQTYDTVLQAAELGDTKSVERLLDRGLDPNTADPKGNTILMIASRLGHRDLVWMLLKRKASARKRSQHGDTALMMASLRGDREIARMLIEFGDAELNHKGWAPIHYAAFENHPEVIRYLVAKGADKDALAPNGYSALMLAARGGHLEAAKALLYDDADVQVKGPAGETALQISLKGNHAELAALLKRAGAVE